MSALVAGATSASDAVAPANEVRLVGRLSKDPNERELPSGDSLWTFCVIVDRERARSGREARPGVDALDCAVWSGRVRRSAASWRAGDLVEVAGAVRRRFYRAGGASVSRVEVEVTRGRLIRRAGSG